MEIDFAMDLQRVVSRASPEAQERLRTVLTETFFSRVQVDSLTIPAGLAAGRAWLKYQRAGCPVDGLLSIAFLVCETSVDFKALLQQAIAHWVGEHMTTQLTSASVTSLVAVANIVIGDGLD